LAEGRGQQTDVKELLILAEIMQEASFCGLGQSVQLPIKSAIAHFGDKFEAGILRN
jgi:NADH-quinone oxidoreductase subunit F